MPRLRRRAGVAEADNDVLEIQELIRFSRFTELTEELERDATKANSSVDGVTPLHIACEVGSADGIEILLNHGADINTNNPSGQTPLDICYSNNHQKTSIFLLERGAQFTAGDVTTSTYSRFHRDVLDTTKNCGRTLLHWAARLGNINALDILVNREVAVNIQNESGSTAMHMACSFKHMHVVEWLHDRGGSLTLKDHREQTPIAKCKGTMGEEIRLKYFPLHCAVQQALVDGDMVSLQQVMDALHDQQQQNNSPENPMTVLDDTNRTPLMMAALADNSAMVNLLLDHALSRALPPSEILEIGDDSPFSYPALALCTMKDMVGMVALLCERGASFNMTTRGCRVGVLFLACRSRCFKAAQELCLHGAELPDQHDESHRLQLQGGRHLPDDELERLIRAHSLYCNWERRKEFLVFLRSSDLLERDNALNQEQRDQVLVAPSTVAIATTATQCSSSTSAGGYSSALSAQTRAMTVPGIILGIMKFL